MTRFQQKIGFNKDKNYKAISDDLYKTIIFMNDENENANDLMRKLKIKDYIENGRNKNNIILKL